MIEPRTEALNLIGGEWVTASSGETLAVENPASPEETLGTAPSSGEEDVRRAVAAASESLAGWRRALPAERGKILLRAADLIEERAGELAHLMALEVGKPMKESRPEVARAAGILRYYGSEGWRLWGAEVPSTRPGVSLSAVREPLGVVALITPWNFPLAIPAWKLAPALVCGNTVVLKPAEQSPLLAAELAQILQEAGLPAGVLNLVSGYGESVGEALVTDARVSGVSFTGSSEVGLAVQQRAVGKRVQLEMGGKNPYVVMEDADIRDAASKVAYSAFGYAGQKCTATSRAIVVEEVYEPFLRELVSAAEALRVGDPLEEDTDVGPLVSAGQYEKVLRGVEQARKDGRVVLDGGPVEREGYYVSPLVGADVDNSSETAQEEIFGPVLAVMRARDFEHALALANDTRYGLTAGIATRSLRYAQEFAREAEVGVVNVNLPTAGVEPQAPFGGRKRSGVGPKEQGQAAIDFYTSWKTVATNPL